MSRVSVVIPVRNDPDGLAATLDALAPTLEQQDADVVVVDDASTDATPTVAEGRPRVSVVRLERPSGSYTARNAGIGASTGRIIALTDGGCVPDAGWLEHGTAALEEDPMTVVAGRIAMPLGPTPTLAAMVDVVHHLDQLNYVQQQGSAVTANILTTREVFDRAGGFDPSLTSSGDREWVTRARGAGATLRYEHDAVVVHPPRSRARQLLRKSARVARAGSIARAESRRLAPASNVPYRSFGFLKPWNRARGRVRLAENGALPGTARWLAVGVAQVAFVQAPQAAVAAWVDLQIAVARRRAAARRS